MRHFEGKLLDAEKFRPQIFGKPEGLKPRTQNKARATRIVDGKERVRIFRTDKLVRLKAKGHGNCVQIKGRGIRHLDLRGAFLAPDCNFRIDLRKIAAQAGNALHRHFGEQSFKIAIFGAKKIFHPAKLKGQQDLRRWRAIQAKGADKRNSAQGGQNGGRNKTRRGLEIMIKDEKRGFCRSFLRVFVKAFGLVAQIDALPGPILAEMEKNAGNGRLDRHPEFVRQIPIGAFKELVRAAQGLGPFRPVKNFLTIWLAMGLTIGSAQFRHD